MIFQLDERIIFPEPSLAEEDGLLAIGGDLSKERLLLAYNNGIFPWYSDGEPVCWYAPHERFVLFPEKIKVSKSMQKIISMQTFEIKMNTAFEEVIENCSTVFRKGQGGTWITNEMKKAYLILHNIGVAQSVEVWAQQKLVGGLYGLKINKVFCGESMFSKVSNASKAALVWLCQSKLFSLIDCQVYSSHLKSMGAEMISQKEFLKILKENRIG
ncbi:MAG: leucyl/phenylalanyl-tRNA--protein transferase [Bacteroidetes bacterium]|nr:leucyl/phenylalanyl-tRNA--protein transferase [Bacteroidota bacterium]MBS1757643.1 leucyl/phenylalanyl-tRNA--protein transferase [Bacteroidota bacterium]